jgi:hypothetical protein
MTNKMTRKECRSLVGSGVFHGGEHGTIVRVDFDYGAEPMYRVQFGSRTAVLRLSEIGSR